MGKHKRERSRSREKKKKKKRERSSSPESKVHKKSHKKLKKKLKKSKDTLPSLDDIISNKMKEKQAAGSTATKEQLVSLVFKVYIVFSSRI